MQQCAFINRFPLKSILFVLVAVEVGSRHGIGITVILIADQSRLFKWCNFAQFRTNYQVSKTIESECGLIIVSKSVVAQEPIF